MRITQVDIWHLRLPFTMPVKHNLATHQHSDNIVLQVSTDIGTFGFGEGIPRDFVTGEHLSTSLEFLTGILIPALRDLDLAAPAPLRASLLDLWEQTHAQKHPAAFCALENAVLDAASRAWGLSVATLLKLPPRYPAVYSAVLPLAPLPQMRSYVHLVKKYGIRFVKIKVGTPEDHHVLHLVRQELGPQVDIRLDANAAWTPAEAIEQIRSFQPFGISAVEQPVAKDDTAGLRQVSEAVDVPLVADESLCTLADAHRLIDQQACQILNIRLSKCGGLLQAEKIWQTARLAGLECQLGSHVGETSLLGAAGRLFALGLPALKYVEGSLAPLYLQQDLVAEAVAFGPGGAARPLAGPGLGVAVLPPRLQALSQQYTRLDVQ